MLRFIDSADHYASGDISEKYHHNNGVTVLAGAGRRGTAALHMHVTQCFCAVTLDSQARWIVGCALRYEGLGPPGIAPTLLDFVASGTRQLALFVTPEGFLRLQHGSTIVGQSLQALHTGIYYFLEVSILFDVTAGEAAIRVDGVEWLHVTGVQTQASAGPPPAQIRLGNTGIDSILHLTLDDIYICDGQGGGTFASFLGDCRVDALYPNADGTFVAWTPSAGTSHYALVEEHPPNDDTDYVSATLGGARDSYHVEPLPTMPSPEVLAVQACVNARKEDVDEILLAPLLVSGGVTSVASPAHALSASYAYALARWTADPNGGGAWTEAAVNSLQVGVERSA